MALNTWLGQRWHAGRIISSMLKSCNHSHLAAVQQGGKLSNAKLVPLTRARGVLDSVLHPQPVAILCKLTWKPFFFFFSFVFFFTFWLMATGSKENSNFMQQATLFSIAALPGMNADKGQQYLYVCFILPLEKSSCDCHSSATYRKHQGFREQSKTGQTCLVVPTDLLIFPKDHGTYSLCGPINPSLPGEGWFTRCL